ncbi:MAG: hypothetical protein R3F56_26220 [Planctomycetota bacterium]
MRPHLCLLVLAPIGAGCSSWPGFDRPHAEAGAYLALYTLHGRASMQSPGAQGPTDNAAMRLSEFGVGDRDDDVGGYLTLGDGFSGAELNYFKLTMADTEPGALSAGFGVLQANELVTSDVEMDEWRLRYVAKLLEHAFDNRVRVEFGGGVAIAHRRLDFSVKRDTGDGQSFTAEDNGVPYVFGRLRGSYGAASLNLDWAYVDGIGFGRDFDGRMQDVEVTGRYGFGAQDATIFAGYRYTELPAQGREGGLAYRADLRLEGFQVGMQVRF